ncbi:SDR family NAD(P)-dependent oxidoreductase [Natrialbaceae archaeon A-CW2]
MGQSLAGQTAIVTGSSSGIGKAIAKRFAAEGANVVVNSRSQERAQTTVDEIEAEGGTAIAVEADISSIDDIEHLVDEAVAAFDAIDVLVNNAGIESVVPIMEVTPEEWQEEIDVNLTGTFFCAQAVGNKMLEQGTGGQIINISSMLGTAPLQGRAAYCATKGALNNLTRTLAVELAENGIHVNALAPGYIGGTSLITEDKVRIPEKYGDKNTSDDSREWPKYILDDDQEILNRIPLARKGSGEEIATCATFLAAGNHYMTGEVLNADGGVLGFGWGSKGN